MPEYLELFKERHDVIFLDKSGYYNMCYNMSKDIYVGAKHEAKLVFDIIDTDLEVSVLEAINEVKFDEKFDNLIM